MDKKIILAKSLTDTNTCLEHPTRPRSRQCFRPVIQWGIPWCRDVTALAWTPYMVFIWCHFLRRWPWSGTIGLGGVLSIMSVIQDYSWPAWVSGVWGTILADCWPVNLLANRFKSCVIRSLHFVLWLKMEKKWCCNLILGHWYLNCHD